MPNDLNKTRVRDSRLAAIAAIVAYTVSRGRLQPGSLAYETDIYVGYFCVVLCVLGRIYSTAFIGGLKNKTLITEGPFAMTRNPLYLFSFIGILGVGFISARISLLLLLFGLHLISYHFLIRREEAWLTANFGAEYDAYRARVPRLIPDFSLYRVPEVVELRPKILFSAIRDGSTWFLVFPLFRLIDHLHATGTLPTWFLLP